MLHYNKTLENTKLNLSYREVILPLLIPLFLLFWISRRSKTVVVFWKHSALNLMVQQSCNPPVLQNRLVHFRVITSPVPKGKIRHAVTARPAENRALVWWRFIWGQMWVIFVCPYPGVAGTAGPVPRSQPVAAGTAELLPPRALVSDGNGPPACPGVPLLLPFVSTD